MKLTRRIKLLELLLTPPARRHIPLTAEQRERAIPIFARYLQRQMRDQARLAEQRGTS
jgi:hypothetical protein